MLLQQHMPQNFLRQPVEPSDTERNLEHLLGAEQSLMDKFCNRSEQKH
jgi:hypothetical protein